jgi:hypothetical protein
VFNAKAMRAGLDLARMQECGYAWKEPTESVSSHKPDRAAIASGSMAIYARARHIIYGTYEDTLRRRPWRVHRCRRHGALFPFQEQRRFTTDGGKESLGYFRKEPGQRQLDEHTAV